MGSTTFHRWKKISPMLQFHSFDSFSCLVDVVVVWKDPCRSFQSRHSSRSMKLDDALVKVKNLKVSNVEQTEENVASNPNRPKCKFQSEVHALLVVRDSLFSPRNDLFLVQLNEQSTLFDTMELKKKKTNVIINVEWERRNTLIKKIFKCFQIRFKSFVNFESKTNDHWKFSANSFIQSLRFNSFTFNLNSSRLVLFEYWRTNLHHQCFK